MAAVQTVEDDAVDGLSGRGRLVRALVTVTAVALLLYGTIAGGDDMWPFGPFHMYSRYYPANGYVTGTSVQAVNAAGHEVNVTEADTGLAHGDIEGQLRAFEADPSRLGNLAEAFHRRHPNASPFVEVRLVQTRWQVRNRRLVGKSNVTLVDWHAR
ncbi:MAG TPA: hypothetical protein VHD81_09910 [Mycobacteriales bacterium]|nr:hypothetical protein [Mycobacteriales bacterium]